MEELGKIFKCFTFQADRRITLRISKLAFKWFLNCNWHIACVRFSVIKRKSVFVLDDVPFCCSPQFNDDNGLQSQANTPILPSDDLEISGLSELEADLSLEGLVNPNAQISGDSLVNDIDPFLWPISDESTDHAIDFSPSRGGSSVESQVLSAHALEDHRGDDIFGNKAAEFGSLSSFEPQQPHRCNMQQQNTANHSHTLLRVHSSSDTSGPSNPFNPIRKLDTPMSDALYPTPSTTPNTQTTIVLSDAEPATLSAIMNILLKSKTKVRFETQWPEGGTERFAEWTEE